MWVKLVASGVLAVALAATLVIGAHRSLLSYPLKRTALDRPVPSVTKNAVERGCAAWGESLPSCVAEPDTMIFSFDKATRM
jgi:hypothetical protein